jgi:hypothetical protein
MSKHLSELGRFKTRIASSDFNPTSDQDKDLLLTSLFHLADISNPSKPWNICKQWTDMLFEEFFEQGDLERVQGLPISYLMDRNSVNIARSQIGFIDVLIIPAY